MAINFPDSPSDNDIYTVNGKRWIYSSGKWSIYGSTAPDATASDTEPSGVGDGHIWYRSDQSQTLIRYDNTWVEVGSAGGFDNASTNFPTSLDSATGFAAVEALQAKVGVDSSAVTSSLDYKVAALPTGLVATQTASHSTVITAGTTGAPASIFSFTVTVPSGRVYCVGWTMNISTANSINTALSIGNGTTTICYQDSRTGTSHKFGGVGFATGSGSPQTIAVNLLFGGTPGNTTVNQLCSIAVWDVAS